MKDKHYSRDHDPSSLVDRLAADELDDDSRRALFVWLDREPARWRRCAMALLEAREFEGALEDWLGGSASHEAASAGRRRPIALPEASELSDRRGVGKRERRVGRNALLALAASVAVAFGLGMAAHRRLVGWRADGSDWQAAAKPSPASRASQVNRPHAIETAANDSRPSFASHGGATANGRNEPSQQVESVTAEQTSNGNNELIPAYVKSQLERRGYRVDSRRRFVSVSLPDGRRALVPLEQWKFRYVGNRAL